MIKIENFYKYDTSSKEAYIKSLMKYENVSNEIATSWAEHGLFELCDEKKLNCPKCQKELKTWRASICVNCGEKLPPWEDSLT